MVKFKLFSSKRPSLLFCTWKRKCINYMMVIKHTCLTLHYVSLFINTGKYKLDFENWVEERKTTSHLRFSTNYIISKFKVDILFHSNVFGDDWFIFILGYKSLFLDCETLENWREENSPDMTSWQISLDF